MNSNSYILIAIAVMAVSTYLVRAIPLLAFRKKIKNKYIYSFLNYIPYAILAALTVPNVIYSTKSAISAASVATPVNIVAACIGAAVAVLLSFFNRSLIVVAIVSTAVVFVIQLLF